MRDTSLWDWSSVGCSRTLKDDIQCGTIIPYWICKIAAHGVYEDLIVVELEDDVGKPPVPLSLEAFTVTGGSPRCGGR